MNERFAKVREILSEPPSEEAWMTLLQELRAWPSFDDKELGIEYLDAHLANWPDEIRALNQLNESPYWRFIRCYHIDQKMKNSTLGKRLMNHPMLKDITALRISVGGFVDHLLSSIFYSKILSQLHTLILEGRSFSDDFYGCCQSEVERFSDSHHQNEIKVLRLIECHRNDLSALAGLALYPSLAGLEFLEVQRNFACRWDGVSGLGSLFQRDSFPALQRLRLRHCLLDGDVLVPFGEGGLCEHLVSLELLDCPLDPERLRAWLAESEQPWALRELHLSGCVLSPESLKVIAEARCLKETEVFVREDRLAGLTPRWLQHHNGAADRRGPRIEVV